MRDFAVITYFLQQLYQREQSAWSKPKVSPVENCRTGVYCAKKKTCVLQVLFSVLFCYFVLGGFRGRIFFWVRGVLNYFRWLFRCSLGGFKHGFKS